MTAEMNTVMNSTPDIKQFSRHLIRYGVSASNGIRNKGLQLGKTACASKLMLAGKLQ
jgi:hypothetical protein